MEHALDIQVLLQVDLGEAEVVDMAVGAADIRAF
jgi:hypothetical protein